MEVKKLIDAVEKSREDQPRLWETSLFMIKLLAVGIVFRAVILLDPSTWYFQKSLASISAEMLGALGYRFSVQGALLVGEPTSYLITRDCLGWKSMAAFIGLVAATGRGIRRSLKVSVVGVVIIGIANTLRIVSTIILSESGLISFDVVHGFLWQWGMTALVLCSWYAWLRFRPEEPARNL